MHAQANTTPVPAPGTGPSDERFHVLFGPGDVRQVALSQLDDFFRLGIVDTETFVWAEGMNGWQTLGEAAGLDEEDDGEDTVVVSSCSRPTRPAALGSAPPPPRRTGVPPVAPTSLPTRPRSAIVPIAAVVPLPVRTPAAAPPPVQRRSGTPSLPHAPVAPAAAPASHLRVVPAVASAGNEVLENKPPFVAEAHLSPFAPEPGRWRRSVQFALLSAALLAGTGFTLHRNDVLFAWAKSLGRGSDYLELEKRWFGGAPLGTPREIEGMLRTADVSATSGMAPGSVLSAVTLPVSAAGSQSAAGSVGADTNEADPPPAEDVAAPAPSAAKPEPVEAAAQTLDSSSAKTVEDLPVHVEAPGRARSAGASRERTERTRSAPSRMQRPAKPNKKAQKAAEPEKPAPQPGSDDFLRASIREAVERSDGKSSKQRDKSSKKGSSSFDPLNGAL